MPRPAISIPTREVLLALGERIAVRRRERRWTQKELADRAGTTDVTVRKVERGDPTVRIGTVLECATLVGVPLLADDPAALAVVRSSVAERLALLPARVRRPAEVDDEF